MCLLVVTRVYRPKENISCLNFTRGPRHTATGTAAGAVMDAVMQNVLNTEWCEFLDKILSLYNDYVKR
jgi:hypothetical protein